MPPTAGAALVAARSPCKGECDCLLFGLTDRTGTHKGRPCGGCVLIAYIVLRTNDTNFTMSGF